ncbi:MAG: GDSL-type esterase/lipase family protein [Planctomycetota bacterium]|nr:GDSL-type esterase/lipase family protein [Planctomycetota bacterium]
MSRHRQAALTIVCLAMLCGAAMPAAADRLEVPEGAHICIIGGGVADAMQHHGWLETLLHSRFPEQQLVIRNLGYEGDEIDPAKRLRSADFGTPDQWLAGSAPIPRPDDVADKNAVRQNRFELTGTRADIVLAFFGANEAHAGPAGLAAFKDQVEAFIKHTLAQKYNGLSPPALVMFAPIAHEDTGRSHWPDGTAHNDNLRLFTAALEEVCQANGVPCVDLFTPTLEAYQRSAENLTEDGIHPNERGCREIARICDEGLFGRHPARVEASLERLRQAVLDKNFYWFNRYRVTDGYSTYGGRAWLKFVGGQTNYEVGQRELEYLDVKTANRDRRIWATAATLADPAAALPPVDDVGLPELISVTTNRPGPLEGGRHSFLSGAEAIGKMTVHPSMKVELVADESRFPELINPVQMSFDSKGRLWVAAWPTYPHWRPDEAMNDKLLILEDDDGDGRTDRITTFAGDLHNPTGFEFWGNGVIVAQGPDVLYLEDTDGDDAYDIKRRIIRGLDTADTHHTANSFTLDPCGTLYFQEGTFHHSQPESPWGPPARVANGAVFSYEPRTGKTGLYTSYAFANPHGHAFSRWGDDIVVDGTGAVPYWGSVFSTRLEGLEKHSGAPSVYAQRTRPCPGIEILSSPRFPAAMQGNLLVANVIGFQGILQYTLKPGPNASADAFPVATEVAPIISSSDPNFRPADLEVGPDGAIYFTDWQNPIIGHMQHNLRDPSRDRQHGRVYRVVMEGTPPAPPVSIAGRPVAELVELLADPTDRVRYRTRIELAGRPETEVVPAVRRWLAGLDVESADAEHHRLEALWMLRHFDQVDVPLLEAVLASPDFRARAAGMRVLAGIADRVPGALDMVRRAAADPHPRVRVEAVRTATFLRVPEAIEALAIANEFPSDRFMNYVKAEAARVLEPEYRRAREAGQPLAFTTRPGLEFYYGSLSNEELAAEPRSPDVFRAMLLRSGLDERLRREAVEGLAKADATSVVKVVAGALAALDARQGEVDSATVFDLIRLLLSRPAGELTELRGDMETLAATARRPIMRRIGYVALMTIDAAGGGGGDASERAWALASGEPKRLVDLIEALPLVSDPAVAAGLYDRMLPLLQPPSGQPPARPGAPARYVRIELPGPSRTLTLAEVEVYADGHNVARQGTASQINTSNNGVAARAIDGNAHPAFARGGQTHCQENIADPWWELDLGREYQVERIVIHNRNEANLGERLRGFSLITLDPGRRETFRLDSQPAPAPAAELRLVSDGDRTAVAIRRAVFDAIVGVKGKETEAFLAIAPFIKDGVDRDAGIRALARIPLTSWPADGAGELADAVIASIKAATPEERSSDAGLAAWQFAENLTRLLPAAEGGARRAILADLGVRVVRIGTVYERMAYDTETIVVQAGRPVLFVLENADAMPHNFVVTQPGMMQAVGELAESRAQDPAFAKASFVPKSPDILAASTLMQPQTTQRVMFEAPTEPGVYPYVCTYPGHWRRMFGAMYVVDDLERYLADPAAYLAAHPVEVKDELLRDRRPRTEWTFADLEGSVAAMAAGRSFVHGRELFRTASCVACHKLGDEGNNFGPELAKLSKEMTALEITRHILDPSLKIDDRYRSTTIITDAGRVITGLVVEETPAAVAIVENPVAKAEPIRIPKSEIDERTTSPVSIMPKGLLDTLNRDEVLDLIAYVAARGDESSCLFSPEPCPHHAGGDEKASPHPVP